MIPEAVFRENEEHLFDLAYRLTGSAADAEDVVQDTFTRALEHPPERLDLPLRPWLVRVAMNVGRDLLRKRRRTRYTGDWLPSPLETDSVPAASDPPDVRYGRLESASAAFLRALEALPAKPRAVLLLRDAFGYSVRETADVLAISEPDVKTTLHRARRVLADYDGARKPPSPALQEATRVALEKFLVALETQDMAQIEQHLAASVRAVSDAGGEFNAAANTVEGRSRVARLFAGLTRKPGAVPVWLEIRMMNGLPALVVKTTEARPRFASRFVIRCEVDELGKITNVETILATRKLARVKFGA
ncbi:MAG: sigma-70 family RNA polymerase sigma factor [Planctomycetota bacterium]